MLGEYILDGFRVAIVVGAMLIGFVALISCINDLFLIIFGITFQQLIGYVFAPIAFLTGVPSSEIIATGSIMATKLVTNEFVAMIILVKFLIAFLPVQLVLFPFSLYLLPIFLPLVLFQVR